MSEKKRLATEAKAFWGTRVDRLRAATSRILELTQTSSDQFRTVTLRKSGFKPLGDVSFDKFLSGKSRNLNPRKRLSMVLLCLRNHLSLSPGPAAMAELADFHALCEEHDGTFSATHLAILLADQKVPETAAPPPVEISPSEYNSFLLAFAKLLRVPLQTFSDIARVFFEEWNGVPPKVALQKRYLCYRFDLEPQVVVKSFVVVSSPSQGEPFCSFANYSAVTGMEKPLVSDGLVIPMRDGLYFLGRIEKEHGLKVMVMPYTIGFAPKHFAGLMLSFDENSIPFAARFLLIPTDLADHVAADCGRKSLISVRREISDFADLGALRNHIEFELEGEITTGGLVLTQDEMREETDRRIKKAGPEFLLEGEPFNPASPKYYTFNGALRMPQKP